MPEDRPLPDFKVRNAFGMEDLSPAGISLSLVDYSADSTMKTSIYTLVRKA